MSDLACLHAAGAGVFSAPRRTLVGRGSLERLPDELLRLAGPGSHVLLVADPVVARGAHGTGLVAALVAAGLRVDVHMPPPGEPDETSVAGALAVAAPDSVVVGIGGGSALDLAKFAAVAVGRGGAGVAASSLEAYLGSLDAGERVAPLALVPTTTGTGAEVTRIAMATVGGTKRALAGDQLIPPLVVLEPALVDELPPAVLLLTAMDALAHAVESALSRARTALSLQASLEAIDLLLALLSRTGPDAVGPVERANAQLAAYTAGLSLNAGVVLGHSIAYGISRVAGVPHGTSCALALPACLLYNDPDGPSGAEWADEQDRRIARVLALRLTGGASASLRDAAAAVAAIATRLGLPSGWAAAGVDASGARLIAERCVSEHPRPDNPRPFDLDALVELCTRVQAEGVAP